MLLNVTYISSAYFGRRKNKEDFLRNLARDNAQLLFNAIWKVLNYLKNFFLSFFCFCKRKSLSHVLLK